MQIERAKLRHSPYLFRQHPESHHDEEIGLHGLELLQELRILQFHRLQNRNTVLDSELLDRAFVDFLSPATRLVSHCDHTYNIVFPLQECLKWSHREIRCAHIDDSRLLEYSCQHTLSFSPPILYAVHV